MPDQSKKDYEDWMNRKWRPTVAWTYIITCIFDFIIFPILWAVYQTYTETPLTPWDPLTLKGAGLFHMAMGAILGITAWSRGQEKMNDGINHTTNNYRTRGKPQCKEEDVL